MEGLSGSNKSENNGSLQASDIKQLSVAIKSLEGCIKTLSCELLVKDHRSKKSFQREASMAGMGLAGLGERGQNNNCTTLTKRQVHIRVVFLKVGEIDTIKEMYTADVFIHGRWREPLFDHKNGIKLEEQENYWTPQLVVQNVMGDNADETWHVLEYDDEGRAMVYEKKRVKGAFLEYLELKQFPFDTQDLTITVSSDRGENEVELTEDPYEACSVNRESFVDMQEWHLHNHVETWTKITTKVFQSNKHKHPSLSAACKVSRRPGFFIWNILVVMLFICSLSFAIFAVDVEKIQNRLQLSFILLLTTVTFKFMVTHNLPKISYTTYMDKYILCSMIFLCSLSLWHVIAYFLYKRQEEGDTTTENADLVAFCVLISLWVCFQLFFVIWITCISIYNKTHIAKNQKRLREKREKTGRPMKEKVEQDQNKANKRTNKVSSSVSDGTV